MNVDLEIVSRRDLALLAAALGRDVYVLHAARSRGRHRLALEVSDVSIVDPRACIAEFVALVSALPRTAKTLWTTAERRRFDIGFDAGATNAVLDADTVRAVARVGGEIAITIYAADVTRPSDASGASTKARSRSRTFR